MDYGREWIKGYSIRFIDYLQNFVTEMEAGNKGQIELRGEVTLGKNLVPGRERADSTHLY